MTDSQGQASNAPVVVANPPATDPAEAEIGRDLHRALGRFMDWAVREWRTALAEVERKQRGYVPAGERDDLAAMREFMQHAIATFEGIGRDPRPRLDDLPVDRLSWHDVMGEMKRDREAGLALWGKVKGQARDELAIGKAGADAIEGYDAGPWERAQYVAVRSAIADGLQPRNGLEWLLIDGMAQAVTMQARWLRKHARTESLDAAAIERDTRRSGEWQPPRLGEAAAVDRAAVMADRFQRQFLRLMKAYRDQRRLLGTVVVAAGGQLNVAEQQVNVVQGAEEE